MPRSAHIVGSMKMAVLVLLADSREDRPTRTGKGWAEERQMKC